MRLLHSQSAAGDIAVLQTALLLLLCFIDITVFNANSVDPDKMLHSAASKLFINVPFNGC